MNTAWRLVVIAASSDSVDDLHRMFHPLHTGIDAAFVVVVKEPPDAPPLTLGQIARGISLPVSYAADHDRLEPGRIFVAPRHQRVTIDEEGRLVVDRNPVPHDAPLADLLFASAAKAFGTRVIGVVMGGRGHDGTAGLRAIHRERGALGIVQSPADTAVPDMAINAVLGDSPDYLPLVDDMGKLLETLIQRPLSRPSSS